MSKKVARRKAAQAVGARDISASHVVGVEYPDISTFENGPIGETRIQCNVCWDLHCLHIAWLACDEEEPWRDGRRHDPGKCFECPDGVNG